MILLEKKLDVDIGKLFDVPHKNKYYHDVPCSALRHHSVHTIYIYATFTTILDNDFTMYAMFRILLLSNILHISQLRNTLYKK